RLDLGDVLEIRALQAAALLVLHALDRERDVLGRERRAVVKLNPFLELYDPAFTVELPRVGEDAVVVLLLVVVFDERLEDMLPLSVDRARAVLIRIHVIGDAGMINRHAVARSGEGIAHERGRDGGADRGRGAVFEKLSAAHAAGRFVHTVSSLPLLLLSLQFGVKQVPEAVSQEIYTENGDENRYAGEDREPWRARHVAAPFAQHRAPGRYVSRHAEPQKAEARLGDDDNRHREGRDHGHARQRIRRDVSQ